MPKPRKANHQPNCSFCGQHKDDVPLLVVSSVNKAGICTWCAMGVLEQTFRHGMAIEGQLRQLMNPKPRIVTGENMPQDKLDVAINKALSKNGS